MILRKNSRGEQVSEHLRKIAIRVYKLISRPNVLEWWRDYVLEWCQKPIRWPAEYVPLPQELSLGEQLAVLAAVHDFGAEAGMELIGPHDKPDEVTAPAVAYCVLKGMVEEYIEEDAKRLNGILRGIRKTLIPVYSFSPDFRHVLWGEYEFTFTPKQAACIGLMHGQHRWLGGDYILVNAGEEVDGGPIKRVRKAFEDLDFTERLRDVFKGNPAWGTLIKPHPTRKNLYRLGRPPQPKFQFPA